MSDVLADVVGAAAGANPISSIVDSVSGIIGRFVESPDQKAAIMVQVQQLGLQQMQAQIDLQKTQMNDASQNIQKDGLRGARAYFCYACVSMLIWNYAIAPYWFHKPPIELPGYLTAAFVGLMLGTAGFSTMQTGVAAAVKVAAMPGDSSANVLGVKLDNKS